MAVKWLLSVDGKTTKGLSVSEVSNNLRGEPGTTVVLELEREGVEKPFKVSIVREDIHLEPVSYATILQADTLPYPIGYISFNEFTEGSAQDFSNTLDDLYYNHGAKGLVIDLRGNGGGIVDEAMQIVNLFVDRNTTIVETRGKTARSNNTYQTRNNPRYKELPLVVLVDKNSASASEIVSGALQDLHRATLVGQRTFGKGLSTTCLRDGAFRRLITASVRKDMNSNATPQVASCRTSFSRIQARWTSPTRSI